MVFVQISIQGDVSAMSQAEQAVEALRKKAEQSAINWKVTAIYTE